MTIQGEEKIIQIVESMRDKGRSLPDTIAEIPRLPYQSFPELLRALETQEVRLQRFAYELNSTIFALIATPPERFWLSTYTSSFAIAPIAAVTLGYFLSWWWLLLVLLIPVAMARTKALYNGVIFRAAFNSERAFCFLYFARQISIVSADYRISYFWSEDEGDEAALAATKTLSSGPLSHLASRMRDPEEFQSNERDHKERLRAAGLNLSLWCANRIVGQIEKKMMLVRFFENTSRDVLLYEALLAIDFMVGFYISLTLPKPLSETFNAAAGGNLRSVAGLAAHVIPRDKFQMHMIDRMAERGRSAASVMEMGEVLAKRLLLSRGKTTVSEPDKPSEGDEEWQAANEIVLTIINRVLTTSFEAGAKRIAAMIEGD